MEERQKQIQVGAGLQESRLNTDLIMWLEKYGWPILTGVLVIAVIYFGWMRIQGWREDRVDRAFEQYQAARGTMGADGVLLGSPEGLLRVADEHQGKASVAALARLDAAEIYLGSARRGLRAGADTAAFKEEDILKPEQVEELARQAKGIFQRVADDTAGKSGKEVLHIRSLWGLASTSISLGDAEGAAKALNAVIENANKSGLTEEAAEAKRRLEALPRLLVPVTLLSDAALPKPPVTVEPEPAPPAGDIIPIERMDGPPPGFADPALQPSGPPAPAPTLPPVQSPEQKPQPPQEQPKQPG